MVKRIVYDTLNCHILSLSLNNSLERGSLWRCPRNPKNIGKNELRTSIHENVKNHRGIFYVWIITKNWKFHDIRIYSTRNKNFWWFLQKKKHRNQHFRKIPRGPKIELKMIKNIWQIESPANRSDQNLTMVLIISICWTAQHSHRSLMRFTHAIRNFESHQYRNERSFEIDAADQTAMSKHRCD
jgi:hypothetical protein